MVRARVPLPEPAPASAAKLAETFAERVIAWQRRHGRHDLPWQRDRNPYAVWVSEIMLQQTQVATVIPYYQRFMAAFPDVRALARAEPEAVMTLWSGLGYYSRARNLHAAARLVVERFDGRLPLDPQALASLPGIGRSTSAAIAALAGGKPCAILDGNVKRVLCRAFGIDRDPASGAGERELWALAERLVPGRDVEAYTQGLMDLGATLCRRHAPDCARCPLAPDCVAHCEGRVAELPRPRKRPVRPQRAVAMLVLHHGARVLLEKRPPTGIWGGLWCFPEAGLDDDAAALCRRRFGADGLRMVSLPQVEHGFTHFRLRIHPLRIEVGALRERAAEPGTIWLPLEEARRAAIPAPVRKLLEAQ
jgi:A/G-specific adenine glycosylase